LNLLERDTSLKETLMIKQLSNGKENLSERRIVEGGSKQCL
jgi:hypothetical protein